MGWHLSSADLFDRECPAMDEGHGDNLVDGLALLWKSHLREGFLDDGQRSFTSFDLSWLKPDGHIGSAYVDYYAKRHAAGAPKLRRWFLSADSPTLLASIAAAHLRLIESGAKDPVDVILASAAAAADAAEFESMAARLE